MENVTFTTVVELLLPCAPDLHLDAIAVAPAHPQITLTVSPRQTSVSCPLCAQPTSRIHSRYRRCLADLPWADVAIRLALHVRRFFCLNPDCARSIFTERLPALVAPWARRTQRLVRHHQAVALALGGAAGARTAADVAPPTSRNTLLRDIRRIPERAQATPSHLGVDDFAKRKGRTYATILVDLDTGRPIELLPERTSEVLASWLAQHPGVELISRDRAGAYAEGASQGAPEALQVADRWHLLANLADALKQLFADAPQALKPLAPPSERQAQGDEDARVRGEADEADVPSAHALVSSEALPPPLTKTKCLKQQRRARRTTQYEQIQALLDQGVSRRAIAEQLHLSRGTVRKYARAPRVPFPLPRAGRTSLLDPDKPYLVERWNSGCHVGTELVREIQGQGYTGGRSIAMDFVASIRKQQGIAPMQRVGLGVQPASDPSKRAPTARELAWLVLKRPDKRDEEEKAQLEQVRQAEPKLAEGVRLAEEFVVMVRERKQERLDDWLERVEGSGLSALKSFAGGIRRDYGAVRAALSSVYSNGVVEGNVNRIKFLKRQMYGRANFDLLRKRVLYAA
jgi:transposase